MEKIARCFYNKSVNLLTKISLHFILYLYIFLMPFKKEAIIINKIFNTFFIIVLILTIFICVFFIPTYSNSNDIRFVDFVDNGELLWPAPRNY